MKKVFESVKPLTVFFVGAMSAALLLSVGYHIGLSENISSAKNELIKAPSHINLEGHTDLEKVYTDDENDIAYYMYKGERDLVEVGEVLHTCEPDIDATVLSMDVYGLYFSPTSPIGEGMSGTVLTNDKGEQIAMISSYLSDGSFFAIWI